MKHFSSDGCVEIDYDKSILAHSDDVEIDYDHSIFWHHDEEDTHWDEGGISHFKD